jgi:hypothetical protein
MIEMLQFVAFLGRLFLLYNPPDFLDQKKRSFIKDGEEERPKVKRSALLALHNTLTQESNQERGERCTA